MERGVVKPFWSPCRAGYSEDFKETGGETGVRTREPFCKDDLHGGWQRSVDQEQEQEHRCRRYIQFISLALEHYDSLPVASPSTDMRRDQIARQSKVPPKSE